MPCCCCPGVHKLSSTWSLHTSGLWGLLLADPSVNIHVQSRLSIQCPCPGTSQSVEAELNPRSPREPYNVFVDNDPGI